MSHHRSAVAGIGLAVALAVSLAGCAGKVRISSKSMCEAHGGSYSTTSKQCSYPAQPSTRSAAQICLAQGGDFDSFADECLMDNQSGRAR